MKQYYFPFLFLVLLLPTGKISAQLDSVIIETYYISDATDVDDGFGSFLEEGSYTYRIYVDLEPGYKLLALGGYKDHPLVFESSRNFYNHSLFGLYGGFNFQKGYLGLGTVPLDSWLTLGFASNSYRGIIKETDPDPVDSSLIGQNAFVRNTDENMGIAPSISDGYLRSDSSASNFSLIITPDSAFGNRTMRSSYLSFEKAVVSPKGVAGPTADNRILIAQLTTKAVMDSLAFELNLEVIDNKGNIIVLVARDSLISDILSRPEVDEVRFSPMLKFPYKRGCCNAWFLQYNKDAVICQYSSCQDSIRLGCMDPQACNYDAAANFHLEDLCCYGPDLCDNRNIELVCPDFAESVGILKFNYYPNPAENILNIEVQTTKTVETNISIYNTFGKRLFDTDPGVIDKQYNLGLDISNFDNGLYLIQVKTDHEVHTKRFIKE